MASPKYDLLRRYGNDPEALAAAIVDDGALRAEVEGELALLETSNNRYGLGSIIDRCVSSRVYANALRKALG